MIVASLVIVFFMSLNSVFYYLNDYQKQYYDIFRFLQLQKQKFKFHALKILYFCLLVILSFLPSFFKFMIYIQFVLIVGLIFLLFKKKIIDKIIPFKITHRIKRFLIEYTVIYGLFSFLCLLFHCPFLWIFILYYIVFFPFFFITCWVHNMLEKIILNHYKKLATKKLKSLENLKIIGITGSFGKTSTKNYTQHLLESDYHVLSTPKSFNTLNGILSVINQKLNLSHQILLLELGIDKPHGMEKFIRLFDFDIATVVAIGPQHLSTFHSIDNIEKEKMKLLTHLNERQIAILNIDDPRIQKYQNTLKAKKITVSSHQKADIYATHVVVQLSGISFKLHIFNKSYAVTTHILGKNHLNDILIAVAIAKANHIEDKTIISKMTTLKNTKHRLEYKKEHSWEIIDDSYNSNFDGFIDALSILQLSKNKKILITPGLIELNKSHANMNEQLTDYIQKSVDLVCFVGENATPMIHQWKEKQYDTKKMQEFTSFKDAMNFLKVHYANQKITILIENDLPETYLK